MLPLVTGSLGTSCEVTREDSNLHTRLRRPRESQAFQQVNE